MAIASPSAQRIAARVRVLGVDPGSRVLGFGLVDAAGARVRHVAHGVVTPGGGPLAERLRFLHDGLARAVAEYRPDVVAVEGVFAHKNARSALVLGHARGVVLLLAAQAGLTVHEYAPARVKRAVGAGGRDGKGAVARMVCRLLSLDEAPRPADASDALAVALCHAGAVRASRVTGPAAAGASSFAERLAPGYVPARRAS